MLLLVYVCVLLCGQLLSSVRGDAQDPFPQAISILKDKEKISIPDETSLGFHNSVNLFVPMDYLEKEQEHYYSEFWEEDVAGWQKEAYNLLLTSSSRFNNTEATYMLATMNLWSHYGFPHNKTLAYQYMNRFNELTNFSNCSALFDLAVMHSTGFFGAIPINIGKGILYYQKSAFLGDLRAKQVLAYRYSAGLNLPRDCGMALVLYRDLADEVRNLYSDHDWEVFSPYMETYDIRIPDFHDGLLGANLSSTISSTSRINLARPDITSSLLKQMNGGQIVLKFGLSGGGFAAEGDDESDDRLVDLYYIAWDKYKGSYGKQRDVISSKIILEMTYKEYNADVPYMNNLQKYYFCECLYLLGHIYFTGEGLEGPNIKLAEKFLSESISIIEKDSTIKSKANIDLGLINQYYKKDIVTAVKYYTSVLEASVNDGTANYQLSKLSKEHSHLKLGSPYTLMQTAYKKSHIVGTYEYAKMKEEDVNDHFNCEDTTFLFKRFVEMNEVLIAPQLKTAFFELIKGNPEVSLWAYAQAAEQGFEAAQVSTAYILYQNQFVWEEPPKTTEERKLLAISYYNRAFKQNNVDAAIVAGDIYYNMGDYAKAISMYQSASLRFSPPAIWNLGYMYEYGLGVGQDYHQAEKFYNQVLEHNKHLYFAVKGTILKLYFKSWLLWLKGDSTNYWNYISNETVDNEVAKSLTGRLMSSIRKASRENSKRDFSENSLQSNQNSRSPSNSWFENFLELTDDMGFQLEDVVSIGFMLLIFIISIIIRPMILRGGWNVRVNGVQV